MTDIQKQIVDLLAQAAVKALETDKLVTDADAALASISRRFGTLTADVNSLVAASMKTRKSRGWSAYHAYQITEKEYITSQRIGDEKRMQTTSRLWKAVKGTDAEAKYQAIADEHNAPTKSAEPVKVTPVMLPEITEFDDLVGPYEGTFVPGSVRSKTGRKSYKTLNAAHDALLNEPSAVGITQTSNGKFKLRAGIHTGSAKGYTNTDKFNNTTPALVFLSPKGEKSWIRKSVVNHTPFSKDSPYDHTTMSAPAEPVVTEPVVTEPVAPEPVASEPVASEPVAPEPVAPEPVDESAESESDTESESETDDEPIQTENEPKQTENEPKQTEVEPKQTEVEPDNELSAYEWNEQNFTFVMFNNKPYWSFSNSNESNSNETGCLFEFNADKRVDFADYCGKRLVLDNNKVKKGQFYTNATDYEI